MIKSSVVVKHHSDLSAILQRFGVGVFEGRKVFCCSLFGYELCKRLNLNDVILLDEIGSDFCQANDLSKLSDTIARRIDAELAGLRAQAGITSMKIYGWEYLNLRFSLYGYLRTKQVAKSILRAIPTQDEILFPFAQNPIDYAFPNWLQSLIIASSLFKKTSDLRGFKYSNNFSAPDAYDYTLSVPAGKFERLCHLPTTQYESASHRARLEEFGESTVDVQSPYWDTPVHSRRISINSEELVDKLGHTNYQQHYKILFESLIREYVEPVHLSHFVERFKNRSLFQIAAYQRLERSPSLEKLKVLEVSEHDAGLQGPLLAIAEERGIEVLVYPHSGFVHIPIHVTKNAVATRTLKKLSSKASLSGIRYREENWMGWIPQSKRKIYNALILLTDSDDQAHYPLISVFDLRFLVAEIVNLLRQKNIAIKIRHKPDMPHSFCLDMDLEEAGGQLAPWLNWCDLCIGVGPPTTALSKFYYAQARCVQLSPFQFTENDFDHIPPDVDVIESTEIDKHIAELRSIIEMAQ
jgi:hypothetical protein